MKKFGPPQPGESVWEAYRVPPAPQVTVTDADVLAHMRTQLAEKTASAARLSAEIHSLEAGIAYLEGGGSIRDIPAKPAPAANTE